MSGLERDGFAAVLAAHLKSVAAEVAEPLDALPIVMCGMVGARTGWREAPYLPLPARLFNLEASAVQVSFAGRVAHILPGLMHAAAGESDVMRGEETQLLGLTLAQPGFTGTVCMPGTHSKWVRVSDGVVEQFHTAMTGELFALLAKHSTLRQSLAGAEPWTAEAPAFMAGARAGLAAPETLLHALFEIRAAGLLRGQTPADAAAKLSGLLIGAELAVALQTRQPGRLALIASGPLAELYAAVFTLAGQGVELFDADMLAQAALRQAGCDILKETP
jgi:2-dehydro-3-deoxygalactonokinase